MPSSEPCDSDRTSPAARSCWRIRPDLSTPTVSVLADVLDRSAAMSAAIPDVTIRRAPSSPNRDLFASLWNKFPRIEKECAAGRALLGPMFSVRPGSGGPGLPAGLAAGLPGGLSGAAVSSGGPAGPAQGGPLTGLGPIPPNVARREEDACHGTRG